MPLADSNRAIGAVTRLITDHLIRRTSIAVTVGRPEQAATTSTNPRLNLFLYETAFDASMKNLALQEGQNPPLWLTLKYLLTAFDTAGQSDSVIAHDLLGRGLAALHEVTFLRLDVLVEANVRLALENNPEGLKLTFDETPVDLLSKIMQGSEESYRLSVAFQVRPVMIVPAEPPAFNLLVGVDYTAAPAVIIGRDGVQTEVLPSMGPVLATVQPESFEAIADEAQAPLLDIRGEDLQVAGLECVLGPVQLPILAQQPDRIRVRVPSLLAGGNVISAGEHPLSVRQRLANGRYRSSNLLVGRLRPTLATATPNVVAAAGNASGNLQLTGNLLGRDTDDVLVGFYARGEVRRLIDVAAPISDQTTLTVPIPAENPIPVGSYQLILRVNGQQARHSPAVVLA